MTIIEALIHRGWHISITTEKRAGVYRIACFVKTGDNSHSYHEVDTFDELNNEMKPYLSQTPGARKYTEDLERTRPAPKPINLESLL